MEYACKLCKSILDNRQKGIVDSDEIQYGFMPRRETVDAVFVFRRLREKYWSIGKKHLSVSCCVRNSIWSSTLKSDLICFVKKEFSRTFSLGYHGIVEYL